MQREDIKNSNNPFLFITGMPCINRICSSKKFSLYLISIAIALIIVHLVFIFFQNSKSVNKILISRESTLNAELTKIENINDILEAEILLLKNETKELAQKKDKKKLEKISKYLADTDMVGKGTEIVLKDSHSIFSPIQEESTIVHNTDLLKFVNFLWANGADAISINEERIVPNSHISCVGPTILVNKKRINSPFVIKAIGEKLNENIIKNDAFVLSLKLRGIELEISQKDNILIPAGKYATFME